jgi:two-component system response regulator DesR
MVAITNPDTSRRILSYALDMGIAGFVLTNTEPDSFCQCIRSVAAGAPVVDPRIASSLWDTNGPLTIREVEVLLMTADGQRTSEIAWQLHISKRTVDNHVSSIMIKLGARNRIDAINIAKREGWI